MPYSTTANIRDEAGFTGNTNITDTKVNGYRDAATSHIDGAISRRYTLPLSETPDILELIERKLAAGHLMLDEYGQEAEGTDKDGQAKVDWAMSMLLQIEEGTLKLVDVNNAELAVANVITMKGIPNDSTEDEDDSLNPQIFKVNQEF